MFLSLTLFLSLVSLFCLCVYFCLSPCLSLVVISLTDSSIKHLSIAKQEQLDDEGDNNNELEGYLMKLIRQLKLLENVCKNIVLYCITNIQYSNVNLLHGLLKKVHSYNCFIYSQHNVILSPQLAHTY